MRLKKPPIVETWMSFRFVPNTTQVVWDRSHYGRFLQSISSGYPTVEEKVRKAVSIKKSKRSGKPTVDKFVEDVIAVRARSEDELRSVQLSPDEMVVNYLKGNEEYPGFTKLLAEAMSFCGKYRECYHPVGVNDAALHYVDFLSLPLGPNGIILTEEYIKIEFRVPRSDFGLSSSFELSAVVHPPPDELPVHVVFAYEPDDTEHDTRKFRLEWHTSCGENRVMSELELIANLRAAHNRLEKCFQSIFTPMGWALLEPENS